MMKRTLTLAGMTLLLTMALSSAAAHADTLTFTLVQATESTNSLTTNTLTYDATVFAPATNTAAINLNGDSFNIMSPLILNDTDFFTNFPFFLNPGASYTGDLFTVTVPKGTGGFNYTGSFSLLGGPTSSSQNTLGTVTFTTVVSPEPSSFVLLGTGLAGALAAARRRVSKG